ncbi:hypothetical protein Bca4012_007418 [Brassica carinata]
MPTERDTIVCLSVFEALRTPTQEIGSNSVSLSESSGKDTVVAKESKFSGARRGSNADVEEK